MVTTRTPSKKAAEAKPGAAAFMEPAEPAESFATLSVNLAAADLKARSSSADAGAARAERSTVAVSAIKAAFREKVAIPDVRITLLRSGVLKGTVSKIATVLDALNRGIIAPGDVNSLNGAYNLVKAHDAAVAAGTAGASGTAPASGTTTAPTIVASTPEDALAVILAVITSEKDPDKAFKLGGEWITRCTNAITDALKALDEEEEV